MNIHYSQDDLVSLLRNILRRWNVCKRTEVGCQVEKNLTFIGMKWWRFDVVEVFKCMINLFVIFIKGNWMGLHRCVENDL